MEEIVRPAAPSRVRLDASAPIPEGDVRPHRSLMRYYALGSLVLGPLFWVILIPRWFRYYSLRYRFDDEGVTMRWGVLYRREITLTFARIQDIHLTSNVVERWLGLAKVQVQTASGNSGAEMTIEGLRNFEQIRDFLYARMRGVRERAPATHAPASPRSALAPAHSGGGTGVDRATLLELASTLREVADEVRALRESLDTAPSHDGVAPDA